MNSCYSKQKNLDSALKTILKKLMDESDDLWKVLKYNESNALSQPITANDKADLTDRESEDWRFKLIPYTNAQAVTKARTEVRMSYGVIQGVDQIDVRIKLKFQILVHHTLFFLDDSKTRENVIKEEIFKVLNGIKIEGLVSKIDFAGNIDTPMIWNQSGSYVGRQFELTMYTT